MSHRWIAVLAYSLVITTSVEAQVGAQRVVTPPSAPHAPITNYITAIRRIDDVEATHDSVLQVFLWTNAPGLRTDTFQGDPADSAYRVATDLFARAEYRAAAERFAELRAKYPTSKYWCNASYNEAFARYRLGIADDLRSGRKLLEAMSPRCQDKSQDVPDLDRKSVV